MVGILLAVMAASCWGCSAVLVRIGLQYLRPTTGTWMSLIPGVLLIMSLAVIFNFREITTLAIMAFAWFALGGLFNFAFGRLLNTVSIQLVGVTRATPLFNTAALFATILAIVFLDETITPWLIVGTISIVSGIMLITSEQAR